jgi:hypothetical protein
MYLDGAVEEPGSEVVIPNSKDIIDANAAARFS